MISHQGFTSIIHRRVDLTTFSKKLFSIGETRMVMDVNTLWNTSVLQSRCNSLSFFSFCLSFSLSFLTLPFLSYEHSCKIITQYFKGSIYVCPGGGSGEQKRFDQIWPHGNEVRWHSNPLQGERWIVDFPREKLCFFFRLSLLFSQADTQASDWNDNITAAVEKYSAVTDEKKGTSKSRAILKRTLTMNSVYLSYQNLLC